MCSSWFVAFVGVVGEIYQSRLSLLKSAELFLHVLYYLCGKTRATYKNLHDEDDLGPVARGRIR
jgi:hypothetical protein